MQTSNFNNLPDELKIKIGQVHESFIIAENIYKKLTSIFPICALKVVPIGDGAIVVSGIVDSENINKSIQTFLEQQEEIKEFHNCLAVFPNTEFIEISVNGESYQLDTLIELQQLINLRRDKLYVEFSLDGHGEKGMIVLMNKTHSLAIYFSYDGDAGFTTRNPLGNKESQQNFILANGQADEYPESMLVENKDAYDIMRYYLLTGERFPGVTWKNESEG